MRLKMVFALQLCAFFKQVSLRSPQIRYSVRFFLHLIDIGSTNACIIIISQTNNMRASVIL